MMRRFLLLFVAAAACDPRLYAKGSDDKSEPKKQPEKPSKPDDDEPSSPPLSPFSALGALGRAKEPGPFDEPLRSKDFDAKKPYTAVLSVSGPVVELEPPFSFSLTAFGATRGTTLRALTARLEKLDADINVGSVILRLGDLDAPMATAEELYAVLRAMKKPVTCHAEKLDDTTALILAGCKKAMLAPGGDVLLSGPALVPLYFKGLLDLVGAQADVVRAGAFKGAAEPLLRTDPSPEMRQTYDDILGGAYTSLVDLVAAGRHADKKKVEGWIDQAVFDADGAKAAGLVDGVASYEAVRDAAAPWKRIKVSDKKSDDFMSLLGLRPKSRVSGDHVTLVYAVGNVIDGRGTPGGALEEIAAGRLAPALRAVADDDEAKAVVLRIDSPGGSALASEVIWQALADLAKKKPVIVSMARLAASGGYYIATPAAKIYAQPDTLTGSIGVFSLKLALGGVLAKIGVHAEELGRGKRALILSPVRPWSDDERRAMATAIQSTYDLFKKRVGAGRKMDPATVEKNAQGRVFTGAEAKKRGLVDEIGGLDDALAAARSAGKLAPDAPIDVYPGEPSLLELLGGLEGSRTQLFAPALAAARLLGPTVGENLFAGMRLVLAAERSPLQAAAFLPLLR